MLQRSASRTAKTQFDFMRIGTLILILMMCAVPILVMAQDAPTGQQEEAAAQPNQKIEEQQPNQNKKHLRKQRRHLRKRKQQH